MVFAMVRSSVLQPKFLLKNENKSFQHLTSLHDIMNINQLVFSQARGGEVYGKVYGR